MNRSNGHSELDLYRSPDPGAWGMDDAPAEPEAQQSLWNMVDGRLRGRWKWMVIAGVVLAVVFAGMGYTSTGPTYMSQGAIRVAPRLPQILDSIPETQQMPFYQPFVATQVQYISSRRVLENAIEDEKLKALPWAKGPNVLKALEVGLDVKSDRGSELIFVGFEAGDPDVARTVCDAIINSYDEIYGRADGNESSHALERLYDLKAQLERDLRGTRTGIQAILARHRTTDLRELHSLRAGRLDELEQKIAAAEMALGRMEANGADENAAAVATPMLRQLESIDPVLQDLRQRRDLAATDFEFYKQRYRSGSTPYQRAQRDADTAEQLFQQQYAKTLQRWDTMGLEAVPGEGIEGFFDGLPLPRLREEIDTLAARAVSIRQENEQLINDVQVLAGKEFEAERTQSDLDRALQRIAGLELEGESIAGRISVVQEATQPHSIYSDGRRKRAVAGFVFGFCVSFGAFFVLGTVDRRTYGAGQLRADAAGKSPRCLGVLPDLGRGTSTAEQTEIASHCVHQIRNQIDVMRDPTQGYVLAVSSLFQGDGKTSIVMALGWSYAAAGYRTLLVDCDFVGRSLTRQLGMVGQEGLKEALVRRDPDGTVSDLPVDQLSVLPVGVDSRIGPESVRQIDLKGIFDQLRQKYDIVIVDTGPLLGSLESTPVTAAADDVVLSMKRGRSRNRLSECVRRIEASGTRCLGIILNGVGRSECSRYVSEASLAAAESERHGTPADGEAGEGVVRDADGRRNALMTAMEGSRRGRDLHEDEAGISS